MSKEDISSSDQEKKKESKKKWSQQQWKHNNKKNSTTDIWNWRSSNQTTIFSQQNTHLQTLPHQETTDHGYVLIINNFTKEKKMGSF